MSEKWIDEPRDMRKIICAGEGCEQERMSMTQLAKENSAMIRTARVLADKIEAHLFGASPKNEETTCGIGCMQDELLSQRSELAGIVDTLKYVAEQLGVRD